MKNILGPKKRKIVSAAVSILLIAGTALLTTACTGAAGSTGGIDSDRQRAAAEESFDIGQDKALEAALIHAGLEKTDAQLVKSSMGMDDGQIIYEFDFISGDTKYEYEIDGTTAAVREFSKEVITSAGQDNPPESGTAANPDASAGSGYIGVDKAKAIALSDAGIKSSAATFTRAKLDRDDGRAQYEIDFYTADREYDYEIDASTGKILDRDSEPLDDWDDDDYDDDWDD